MAELDQIVQININRETTALASASFGLPLIATDFTTAKTTPAFDRYREYASLTAMADDGWGATDKAYQVAQVFFAQNPRVPKIAIGRIDSSDANLDATLNAIADASNEWYGLIVAENTTANVTFAGDLVTDNSIVATVNGIVCSAVVFATDIETTMGLLKTEIEARVSNTTVTIGASPFNTMTITGINGGIYSASFAITGGASQTTASVAIVGDATVKLAAAAWAESNEKLHGLVSSDADILDVAETGDLASQLKALSYLRTYTVYNTSEAYANAGIMATQFPGTPGRATWCYKTISGVAASTLTGGQKTGAHGKNCNTYTTIADVGVFEQGKVAVGEYIDIVWGLDYLKSQLQTEIFSELKNVQKIPYTDAGVSIITGIIKKVLKRFATDTYALLQGDSIVVAAPLVADVSANDKANRLLPDVTWEALLQGAIHTTKITGTVSL